MESINEKYQYGPVQVNELKESNHLQKTVAK